MVTSPHHLASEAGLRVLREGGNAIEATVAMAASLAVVYPHMNSIGGDGFWLICAKGAEPIAIDACGRAAATAIPDWYLSRGLCAIPRRGAASINTVAGTLSGWAEALTISAGLGGRMPLSRLIEDAAWSAEHGFPVSASQQALTQAKRHELLECPGFAASFLPHGTAPREGQPMKLPSLAATLRRLARDGAMSFYQGALAREIAADLKRIGSPLSSSDLDAHRALRCAPLRVRLKDAHAFNLPAPTQGLSSLMILALFERLGAVRCESFAHVHGLVEATKQAFTVRDRVIGDPGRMVEAAENYLQPDVLDRLAARIDPTRALPWPHLAQPGDTVWLGAIDASGLAVSFIQSVFFEFGSGCVLENSGILWQNRGASFELQGAGLRVIGPGRKPFHTLNPALALFTDGRRMVYGTMGGEGQPQTQAAIFTRYALFGCPLQEAVTAPRWLLGRTWGEETATLKLEQRFPAALLAQLREAGHDIELLPQFSSTMGHAGAVVLHADGTFEGAADPRSDGAALGF